MRPTAPHQTATETNAATERTSLTGSVTAAAAVPFADPRSRSAQGWSARKAVLASRGEVDGERIAEADAALSWWRVHRSLSAEVAAGHLTAENVERVLEQLANHRPRS